MRRRRREIKQNAKHHPTALLPLHVEARVGVTSCRLLADLPHALHARGKDRKRNMKAKPRKSMPPTSVESTRLS